MWGQTIHGGRFKVTHAPALQPRSVSNPNVLIGSPDEFRWDCASVCHWDHRRRGRCCLHHPEKEMVATFNCTSLYFQQNFRENDVLFYFIDTGLLLDLQLAEFWDCRHVAPRLTCRKVVYSVSFSISFLLSSFLALFLFNFLRRPSPSFLTQDKKLLWHV